MRKKKLYKNKEPFYPITHTEAVLCPDGQTVEQRLQTFQNDVESKLSGGKAANVYPFKDLGTCSNIALANNALDTAFVSEDETLQGHLRLIVNGQIMWIDQIAVNYTKGYWLQVVFGAFTLSQDTNTLVSDYSKYHISYRFRNEANTSMAWHDFSTEGLQLKTINGQSLIGTGNIVAGGSGDPTTVDAALDPTSINPIQNKAVYDALFGENGLDWKITTIGNAVSSGKVVMVDSWGTKPSSPTTGIVAYVAGEGIYTYGTGGWGNAVVPDATAIYVNKNMNIVYRWDADNEEMDSLVGQEIDDTWVLNSSRPVQSKVLAKRFKKLEIAMFGTEQGNSDETSITNDSLAKDMEDMKDAVFGEEQSGTRSGGLNNELTGIKDALYGQGGTAQAPAQGSISQKVSNLETEAIKGIKVNGQTASVIDGVANVTIREQQERAGSDAKYLASIVSDVQVNQTTYGANTLEIEIVDYVPIVSSETWDGSGDAKVVYNKYAANLLLRVVKDEVTTYYSDWESATDIPAKRYIGSSTLLNYEVDDDTCLATFNNGALVQVADCTLCVDAVTSRLLLRKDDVYYWSWLGVEKYHSSEYISDNGIIIQFKLSGTTFLASYNKTEHKITPIGGNDTIAQIDNSDKPVQSQVLKQKFDEIDGDIAELENVARGNSSFTLLSDKDEAFSTFDYRKGNPGCFTPKVAPEDITVEDLDSIYKVKLPYGYDNIGEVPKGPMSLEEESEMQQSGAIDEPHLFTAYEMGLSTNSSDALDNGVKLQTAINNENCIGFYLDQKYYVDVPKSPYTVTRKEYDPVNYPNDNSYGRYSKGNCRANYLCDIYIHKPFIISGKTNGAKGGFIVPLNVFYADASIYMESVSVQTLQEDTYVFLYINTEHGIDQVQIKNCDFTSSGNTNTSTRRKGTYIWIYSPNTRPYKLLEGETFNTSSTSRSFNGKTFYQREAQDFNYLNHLYVANNTFEGVDCIHTLNLRMVKSARVINNTFTDICGQCLAFECINWDEKLKETYATGVSIPKYTEGMPLNGKSYLWKETGGNNSILYQAYCMNQAKVYMSCPLYIAGNKFEGIAQILKLDDDDTYMSAFLTENSVTYAIHNHISNLITGRHADGNTLSTYDCYDSCQQVYNVNNRVKNVVIFAAAVTGNGGRGFCMSKSPNIQLVWGGLPARDLVRYYKRNHYILETDVVTSIWNNHLNSIKPGLGEEESAEYTYDKNLNINDVTNEAGKVLSYSIAQSVLYDKNGVNTTIYPTEGASGDPCHPVLKEFVFSDNFVDAGDGHIHGTMYKFPIPTAKLSLCGNTFRASRFCNSVWDDANFNVPGGGNCAAAMFPVRLATIPKFGSAILEVKDNTFTDTTENPGLDEGATIRFVINQYYASQPSGCNCMCAPEGDISIIQNNKYVGPVNLSLGILKAQRVVNSTPAPTIIFKEEFAPFNAEVVKGLQDANESLRNTIYGKSTEGMSTEAPATPKVGDEYVAMENGITVIKKCTAVDSYAIVSLRLKSLQYTQNGNLCQYEYVPSDDANDRTPFTIPLLDGEVLTWTTEELTSIGLNGAWSVESSSNASKLKEDMAKLLVKKGYTNWGETSNSSWAGRTGQTNSGFDFYDVYLRICPKNYGAAVSYMRNAIGSLPAAGISTDSLNPTAIQVLNLTKGYTTPQPATASTLTKTRTDSKEGSVETWMTEATGGLMAKIQELQERLDELSPNP